MYWSFWPTLILFWAIQVSANNHIFHEEVDFYANVKSDGTNQKICEQMKVTLQVFLKGNLNEIRLKDLTVRVLNDEVDEWKSGMFGEEVQNILKHPVVFKITKGGKTLIQTSHFNKDELPWSKSLKKAILNMYVFEVDKEGDGTTGIRLNIDEAADLPKLAVTIPGYKSSTLGKCLRSRTNKPRYEELFSVRDESILCKVKQYDTESDQLKKRQKLPEIPYDLDAELNCRPFLKQFAKKYDSRAKQNNLFGKGALNIVYQTYNDYHHQKSTYYVYFLMKESVIKGAGDSLTLETFLRSIFYVGKGEGNRVFQHLKLAREEENFSTIVPNSDSDLETDNLGERTKRALDENDDNDENDKNDENDEEIEDFVAEENVISLPNDKDLTPEEKKAKVNTILKEWKHGFGIICYRVTEDVLSAEAFTLEAIAIEGYGNKKYGGTLTNLVRGHYGRHNKEFAKWFNEDDEEEVGMKKVEKVAGAYYQNAFESFKTHRHRPVYAHDVKHMKI